MLAEQLKQSLLQAAMEGKLSAPEPGDDSADDLLAAIRAEKERRIAAKEMKREKPLPPLTEDEIPFEIPDHWRWVRLGEIVMRRGISNNKIKEREILTEGKYPVVSQSIERIIGYTNDEEKLLLVKNPVIVFGDHNKVVKHIDFDFVVGADGTVVLDSLVADTKFLYYVAMYAVTHMENLAYGRHYKYLKNQAMPLPPLAEQRRIVARLEQMLPWTEELREREAELAELDRTFPTAMKHAVLQAAMEGKLSAPEPGDDSADDLLAAIRAEKERRIAAKEMKKETPLPPLTEEEIPFEIPDHWRWVRLGEIGDVISGGTPKTSMKEYWSTREIPWITPADMSGNDKYISGGRRFISEKGLKNSSAQHIPERSIVISSRAPIGYVKIARNDLSTNQGCKSVYAPNLEESYLYYVMLFSAARLRRLGSGTTFLEVSKNVVTNFPIPLPPLAEQRRIVARLERILPLCEALVSGAE
ncbi:MAG: restriction endonuclease subunit S [Veillonellaceae bacterium]|nr:restriction endonuclease subunit S [Veillonellaceae bacterium]